MRNINEVPAEEYFEEMELRYNAICEATLVKMYAKAQNIIDLEDGVIPLKNFDFRDANHLFVLAVARGLGGIKGCQVAVDTNPIRLWWENRKIKVEGSKLLKYKKEYNEHAIDVEGLLSELYEWATELCGYGFDFSDIYYEFYA